jgi:hypothetical protein
MNNLNLVKKEIKATEIKSIDLYKESNYFFDKLDFFLETAMCSDLFYSLDTKIHPKFTNDLLNGVLVISKEGQLYTFDKTHRLQVIIPTKLLIKKLYDSNSLYLEADLNKFLVTFRNPYLEIKIGHIQNEDLFSISYVLLITEYAKHNKQNKKPGSPLYERKDKLLPYLEDNQDLINMTIEFFTEIKFIDLVKNNIKLFENFKCESWEKFFLTHDYLFFTNDCCIKTITNQNDLLYLPGQILINNKYEVINPNHYSIKKEKEKIKSEEFFSNNKNIDEKENVKVDINSYKTFAKSSNSFECETLGTFRKIKQDESQHSFTIPKNKRNLENFKDGDLKFVKSDLKIKSEIDSTKNFTNLNYKLGSPHENVNNLQENNFIINNPMTLEKHVVPNELKDFFGEDTPKFKNN